MKMLEIEGNKLMFDGLPTDSSARNEVKAQALRRCGLALRGARATGLSLPVRQAGAASPRSARRSTSGFPLLSLAEVLRISSAALDWFIARTKPHVGVLHQHAHRMFYCCHTVFIRPSILSFSFYPFIKFVGEEHQRRRGASLLLLFFFGLNVAYCQATYLNPDIPLSNSITSFDFIHVVNLSKQDTADVKIGEKIGSIEKHPDKLSKKFEKEIRLSMNSYEKNDFNNAKIVLKKAAVIENQNPFILNAYARACYHVDKPTSFIMYKNLIAHLDSTYRNADSTMVVDIWFREAYWKLGTLYMDRNEWKKAYYEISRFALAIQELKGQKIYTQALEYLTECAFNLREDKLTNYLANRVLSYDKQNEYAQNVLNESKK
jgi:hypothetical protein